MFFLNQKKTRNIVLQGLLLLFLVVMFVMVANNTISNLERRGISSGFGFLAKTAGFDISMHLVDYDEQSSYGDALLVSILNTLLVSLVGVFFATGLGVFFGVSRLSQNWLLRKLAGIYIETLRNIPLLLQIFFWYFAVFQVLPHPRNSYQLGSAIFLNIRGLYLPAIEFKFVSLYWFLALVLLSGLIWGYRRLQIKSKNSHEVRSPPWFFGLMVGLLLLMFLLAAFGSPLLWELPQLKGFNFQGGWTLIPEFLALLLALATYTSSFIAEIVRAGVVSVAKGQLEASFSLGLSRRQTLQYVVLPQALKVIVPPLTSQYLNLVKNSSLASAIAFPDLVLVFAGTTLNQTGQALEVVFLTMVFYLLVSLSISLFMNWYNRTYVMVGER